MVTSSPSVNNLDLNLALTAQPNVVPSVRLDVPDAHPAVPAICPNLSLTFDNRPITLHDSVLLHDSTAGRGAAPAASRRLQAGWDPQTTNEDLSAVSRRLPSSTMVISITAGGSAPRRGSSDRIAIE